MQQCSAVTVAAVKVKVKPKERANVVEVRELYGTMDLTHFISRLAPAFSNFFLQIF